MLNQLFNGSAGFAWGVRASGFLTLGILLIAIFTMTTRHPPKAPVALDFKGILTDLPFMMAVMGWVHYVCVEDTSSNGICLAVLS